MLVRRGTSYSTLLSLVLMMLSLHREDCDMKLKTLPLLSPTEKFLHIIESNEDLEVVFGKYMTDMKHMVMIYADRKDKYILKTSSEDGETELEK